MQVSRKPARLEDFRESKPKQLSFFSFEDMEPAPDQLSNLIDLYDAVPKYVYGRLKRDKEHGLFLQSLTRNFVHRDSPYTVVVHPARIKTRSAEYRDHFPSSREEVVEDVLRKFACDGQSVYLTDTAGERLASVVFSLYQVRMELKSKGHELNIQQIKEALFICGGTRLEIIDGSGKTSLQSTMFATVGLDERSDKSGSGKKSRCFVRFHPLVTQSINELTFRQYNYETVMRYRRSLSRWLHKQLSLNFTQAHPEIAYNRKLKTILRDSGTQGCSRIQDNVLQVTLALDEMQSLGVLESYEVVPVHSKINKRKFDDVSFFLFVSRAFTDEMIKANKRHKELLAKKGP